MRDSEGESEGVRMRTAGKFAMRHMWNVYRYPTDDEVSRGRPEWDMFWIGAERDRHAARKLLGSQAGQLQFGIDGEVENISAR
jgi:hypothetical protein